tara:strand:- start:30106 stop:31203 length:1098 start_codon:yes stop_codon:yes gene_type:complete
MTLLSELINEKKRILVTGGAGFIGSALIRRLLLETDSSIFNLDKLSYCSDLFSINKIINQQEGFNERYKFLKVDLTNSLLTEKAIKDADPDLIFHLAAESHVDRSIDDPICFINNNVIGTSNILNAGLKHFRNLNSKRKESFRFLHISTDEVFGTLGETGRFTESTKYDPRSPYSASKAASDHIALAWHHTFNLPVIITNCSNNFGPWQFPEKLIPVTILKAIENEPIPIYGDGRNIRDWLYVDDHIDGLVLAIINGKLGKCYCIGGHGEKNNLEIVNTICNYLDDKRPKNVSYSSQIKFVKDRPGHDKRYSIDSSLITRELKWKPNYGFTDAIHMTTQWYLENIDWCNKVKKNSGYKGQRLGLG